jgi:hypothetical protein
MNEQQRKERIQRFAEVTGLEPLDPIFPICENLPLPQSCLDHVKMWLDGYTGRVFITTSPYGDPAEHAAVFARSGFPWFVVPEKYAPHCNRTTTYLFAFPWGAKFLEQLRYKFMPLPARQRRGHYWPEGVGV